MELWLTERLDPRIKPNTRCHESQKNSTEDQHHLQSNELNRSMKVSSSLGSRTQLVERPLIFALEPKLQCHSIVWREIPRRQHFACIALLSVTGQKAFSQRCKLFLDRQPAVGIEDQWYLRAINLFDLRMELIDDF
jgi:hypothetical protein